MTVVSPALAAIVAADQANDDIISYLDDEGHIGDVLTLMLAASHALHRAREYTLEADRLLKGVTQ